MSKQRGDIRIIAGRFRGRRLRTNPGLVTRPIPDSIKEMLFERLGGGLHGERVLDAFAGTGTLGLEALSRGAGSAVFIESDHRGHRLLQDNVSMLGLTEQTLCWRTNVFHTSFRPKGVDEFLPYDLIFFDPPYRMMENSAQKGRIETVLRRLADPRVTAAEATLILRTPEGVSLTAPKGWESAWEVAKSSMVVHKFRKSENPATVSGE